LPVPLVYIAEGNDFTCSLVALYNAVTSCGDILLFQSLLPGVVDMYRVRISSFFHTMAEMVLYPANWTHNIISLFFLKLKYAFSFRLISPHSINVIAALSDTSVFARSAAPHLEPQLPLLILRSAYLLLTV
jgi:hypothetical protein